MSTARTPNRRHLIDLGEVKASLAARIDSLVEALFGNDAARFPNEYRIGSAEGGPGESCVIFRTSPRVGGFHDHNPAARYPKGDLITLIAAAKGLQTGDAIRWGASFVGLYTDNAFAEDDWNCRPAGADQLQRRVAAFWRTPAAVQYFVSRGLTETTLRRFQIGIAAAYQSKKSGLTVADAVCFPVIDRAGTPIRRFGMIAVPGLTQNALAPAWCPGEPRTYYASTITGRKHLFVAEGQKDLWLLAQVLTDEMPDLLIISSTHGSAAPKEWSDPGFWKEWETVYFGQDSDSAGDAMAQKLAKLACREIRRVRLPNAIPKSRKDWTDFFREGGSAVELKRLMAEAPVLGADPAQSATPGLLTASGPGEFEVQQVNVNGAYANGQLYYPFMIESVEIETEISREGVPTSRTVTSYKTKVVRSDAAILDIIELPAPKGTPRERRVLALTDGTRIIREPQPNNRTTWPLRSINTYISRVRAKQPVARSFGEIVRDLRLEFEASVWLPNNDDHLVLALYAAMSYVYTIFDAIPLMLVTGERGTGKTALAEAMEAMAFNAILVGRASAASAIRAANESRGLMILDDLEQVGRALADEAFSDLHQMLKLSYKKATGRKTVTEKSGRTVEFDFYGPKIVNNTTGIDPITLSRMYEIRTRKMPKELRETRKLTGYDPRRTAELRIELHSWAMAHARDVDAAYRELSDEIGRTDRADEISIPLRVLASLTGDAQIWQTLDNALDRQNRTRQDDDEPNEILREAVHNIIRQGATTEMSLAQVCLELRLSSETGAADRFTNNQPIWKQSWWISNQLAALDLRDHEKPTGRRRLFGYLTKIFAIPRALVEKIRAGDEQNGVQLPPADDVFEFCTGRVCTSCPYSTICVDTIEGMQHAKMRKGSTPQR